LAFRFGISAYFLILPITHQFPQVFQTLGDVLHHQEDGVPGRVLLDLWGRGLEELVGKPRVVRHSGTDGVVIGCGWGYGQGKRIPSGVDVGGGGQQIPERGWFAEIH
jgi:hypothetical protein